jgi:hypothetical protein
MRWLGAALRPLRSLGRVFRATRRTVEAVPDLVDAILVLPEVNRQLEVVAFQTATLREMHEEIVRVHGDTSALVQMDARLAQLVEVAVPLQATAVRLGRLGDRWPQRRQLGR